MFSILTLANSHIINNGKVCWGNSNEKLDLDTSESSIFYFFFCVAEITFTITPPIVANVPKTFTVSLAVSNFLPIATFCYDCYYYFH